MSGDRRPTKGAIRALISVLSAVCVLGGVLSGQASAAVPAQIKALEAVAPSAVQAEADLVIQDRATEIDVVSQVEEELGSHFGGLWFDAEAGEFVVDLATVGESSSATKKLSNAVGDSFASASLDSDYRTDTVRYSQTELEADQARLNEALQPYIERQQARTGLDPEHNAVIVSVPESLGAEDLGGIEAALSAGGVPAVVRSAKDESFEPSPQSGACSEETHECELPYRGGTRIWSENFVSEGITVSEACTSAFRANGNDGQKYILTAGHCAFENANPNDPINWTWSTQPPPEQRSQPIGTMAQWHYPGKDWAKINATGTWADTAPWPNELAYWGSTTEYPITGEARSYVGQTLCHIGATTGTSCGIVTEENVTTEYTGGVHVNGMFLMEGSGVCLGGGDSGGPIVAGNIALGILSGGRTGCGWSSGILFSDITAATAELNVNLVGQGAPEAITGAPTSLQPYSATLSGQVNPHGLSTTFVFEYGKSGFTNTTGGSGGSGQGFGPVSATATGLEPATTYKYRLKATNSLNSQTGSEGTFTTPPAPPTVTTGVAEDILRLTATLTGSVNPLGSDAHYRFEYGPTVGYGSSAPAVAEDVGAGRGAVQVSTEIGGLSESTLYHYRITATNAGGTSYGSDHTFTTLGLHPIYQSKFGSQGLGAGKFQGIVGTSVDPAGNVWIADSKNRTIQKFSAGGDYLGQLSIPFGTGKGQLYTPTGIAVDEKGQIWVDDSPEISGGAKRVQAFNEKGELLHEFTVGGYPEGIAVDGKGDVFVAESGYRVGEYTESGTLERTMGGYGTGPGQLSESPSAIAVSPEGSLWVADPSKEHPRVEQFGVKGEFVGEFGSKGTGNGQFSGIAGLARDGQGDVYVADQEGDRVEMFSENGGYVTSFGSKGSADGQFVFNNRAAISTDPYGGVFVVDNNHFRVERWLNTYYNAIYLKKFGSQGIGAGKFEDVSASAVDANGAIWIADSNMQRIQQFSASGVFLGKLNVAHGTGKGQIYTPEGIAIDSKGRIWVSDNPELTGAAKRVQAFSQTGALVHEFSIEGFPSGIGVDDAGNVWVAESDKFRVREYTETGTLERTVGGYGTGPGQLVESPTAIAVSPGGSVWVVDPGEAHPRVEQFNANGELVREFGSAGTGPGQFTKIAGITRDGKGDLFVADQEGDRVEEFTEGGTYIASFGTKGAGEGQFVFDNRAALSTDYQGNVYAYDGNHFRVEKWLNTYYSPVYLSKFGSSGTGVGQLNDPVATAVDPIGNVWVADERNQTILKYSANGEYLATLNVPHGTGTGQIYTPSGLAVDAKSQVWVADSPELTGAAKRVQAFSAKGELLHEFSIEGFPSAVGVDGSGNVWVAESNKFRVREYTETGTLERTVGGYGTGPGQLAESPSAIAVSPGGGVWVADPGEAYPRVEQFNANGELVREFGSAGTGVGRFTKIAGITRDGKGDLFVADQEGDRVEEFTEGGTLLSVFGTRGAGDGQFLFTGRAGLSTDSRGTVYAIDGNHTRVEKWFSR